MKKSIVLTLLLLLPFIGSGQQTIKIREVNNKIELGPFAGSRDLAFGVQTILEEVVQDKGYNLSYNSELEIQVELLFFDVRQTSVQISIFGKQTDVYQIIARGVLLKNGKKKKLALARGEAKQISTSTIILDEGGKFSQTNVSTALKKVCIELIDKLKI